MIFRKVFFPKKMKARHILIIENYGMVQPLSSYISALYELFKAIVLNFKVRQR